MANSAASLVERLRAEADLSEKGLAFMGDPELAEETAVQIALLRNAANEIERLQKQLAMADVAYRSLAEPGIR